MGNQHATNNFVPTVREKGKLIHKTRRMNTAKSRGSGRLAEELCTSAAAPSGGGGTSGRVSGGAGGAVAHSPHVCARTHIRGV
jgi:hypothetical protein